MMDIIIVKMMELSMFLSSAGIEQDNTIILQIHLIPDIRIGCIDHKNAY